MTKIDIESPAGAPAKPMTHGHFHVLGKNVILKYASELSRLFQFAFFIVIARVYGPADLGRLTVLLMIGSAVGLFFGDLGINTAVIARISRASGSERDALASQAWTWKLILNLVSAVLILGAIFAWAHPKSLLEVASILVISIGGVLFEFISAITNGVNRFDLELRLRFAYRGLVYGIGALVALRWSLETDLLVMAVSTIFVIVLAFLLCHRGLLRMHFSRRYAADLSLLRESVPVWITQFAQMTYLKFDVVVLGMLHVAAVQTGWYAAGWKIADVLTTVPSLLCGAALPLLCGSASGESVAAIAPRYLKFMYVLPFYFALPLSISSDWLTKVLYGESFTGTPHILRILVWAVVPIFVHSFLATISVAVRRQRQAAKLAAVTSAAGILSAIFLVPRFGYEAMAIVCLVANSLFALAMVIRFRDVTGMHLADGMKCLGSALAVYLICRKFTPHFHPVLLAAMGVIFYSVALFATGVIRVQNVHVAFRYLRTLISGPSTRELGVA